jgi:hypothetical protein
MRLRVFLPLSILSGAFVFGGALVLTGCSDNKPPVVVDKGKPKDGGGQQPDQYVYPDLVKNDQPVWPDQPKYDLPPPADAYVGTPFGCQSDTDCFGQVCCATPWGVKLCAPSCDLK